MRILLVCNTIPFPAKTGLELPVEKHFSHLSTVFNVDFLLLHADKRYFEQYRERIPKTMTNVYHLTQYKPGILITLLDEIVGKQVKFLNYSYDKKDDFINSIKEVYDLIWYGSIQAFSFNLFCNKNGIALPDKIGLSLHDITTYAYRAYWRKIRYSKYFQLRSFLTFIRSYSIASIERKIINDCAIVHVVTEAEKRKGVQLIAGTESSNSASPFLVAVNGRDEKLGSVNYAGIDSNVLLFMTHLSGIRKKESRWFLKYVWPKIRANSDLVLWVVGKPPVHTSIERMFNDKRIEIVGFVDDLIEVFKKTCLMVLPIFHDSGYINRMYHALNIGVPLITTSWPASTDNRLKDGIHLSVADEATSFADTVLELYKDRDLRSRISRSSRDLVSGDMTWDDSSRCLEQRIRMELSNE